MPRPTSSLATLRPELGQGLEQFNLASDRQSFVGTMVLPVFNAAKSAGSFSVRTVAQILQGGDTSRAPGAGYGRGTQKFSTATYATAEQGWEETVDDNDKANYRDYIDAELVATQRAYDVVLRNQEIRIADAVFSTATFTGAMTNAVGTEWSNASGSDPISDIDTAKKAIWDRTGLWADTLILNYHVFMNLRKADAIIDRIQSAGAGNAAKASDVTTAMIANVFDIAKVVVCGAPKNTGNEADTTPTISNIWSSEYAMLCVTAKTNDLREPCIGRTFHWAEDGSQIGGTVESYRDETIRGDVIRVRHQVGEKIIYPELGQLLSNITA